MRTHPLCLFRWCFSGFVFWRCPLFFLRFFLPRSQFFRDANTSSFRPASGLTITSALLFSAIFTAFLSHFTRCRVPSQSHCFPVIVFLAHPNIFSRSSYSVFPLFYSFPPMRRPSSGSGPPPPLLSPGSSFFYSNRCIKASFFVFFALHTHLFYFFPSFFTFFRLGPPCPLDPFPFCSHSGGITRACFWTPTSAFKDSSPFPEFKSLVVLYTFFHILNRIRLASF